MRSLINGHAPQYHQILVSRELGGAGLIALGLARHLRDQGEDSHVWIPDRGSAWNEATRQGLSCHPYNYAAMRGSAKMRAALANWRLGLGLRHRGPGLVHVHEPLDYGAMWYGMKLSGLKRVVHTHLDIKGEGLRWALRHPPELIITCAKFLIPHVREALPERLQGRQQIAAVPNAVDTDQFYPLEKQAAKQRVGAPSSVPLLLMLANLAPHKGQETAIRATALLKQRGVDVNCWLAGCEREGSGRYTARLRDLSRDQGVADRVHLLGFRSDAPDLLRAADFFLLPSTCEGLPLSILEAQASKTLVLANATAGVPEVIADGKTGFLIPADDVAGYAHHIDALLHNAELYQRITEQACARVRQEHNWQTYQERIRDLYQDVMEIGRPADSAERVRVRVGPWGEATTKSA